MKFSQIVRLLTVRVAALFPLRGRPSQRTEMRAIILDAVASRPGGALILGEGKGLDPRGLADTLIEQGDAVIIGRNRFAVCLAAPGRDAEFARWLCRAQVWLEEGGGTVRMGATRTGSGARPEDHVTRAERALARATGDGTAFVIGDCAPPLAIAAEVAVMEFDALPVLSAEHGRLVAIEPVTQAGTEDATPATLEAARHIFLTRLKAGAGMLRECRDRGLGLSLRLPDDLAADPDLHLALVFGLDGCELPPNRVTLRVGEVGAATKAALAATGCVVSTAIGSAEAVGPGPHWLPQRLLTDDAAARQRLAAIFCRADETGALIHASGVPAPGMAPQLAALGCALVSGPGIAAAVAPDTLSAAQRTAATDGTRRTGKAAP